MSDNKWICNNCGTEQVKNFCEECGAKRPVAEKWQCLICGKENDKGKFCKGCGKPKGAKPEAEVKTPPVKTLSVEKKKQTEPEVQPGATPKGERMNESVETPASNGGMKKVLIPVFAGLAVIGFAAGAYFMLGSSSKQTADKPPFVAGQQAADKTAKQETKQEAKDIPAEQKASANDAEVKKFKDGLKAVIEKEKKEAKELKWLTMNVYKKGNDVIVEGCYLNGGADLANKSFTMKMDIDFYANGKEAGTLKNVGFDPVKVAELKHGATKNIRYTIKGKAGEVKDFTTFRVKPLSW